VKTRHPGSLPPSTLDRSGPTPLLLARSWRMMAARGLIAALFGLTLLAWPGATLDRVVAVFAAYAILDGLLAVTSAVRVSHRLRDAWPITVEGAVSIALGAVALGWPFVPRPAIYLIATWGVLTGILELAAATWVPLGLAARWLMATGGASSVFLARVVAALPHAYRDRAVWALGAYALVFGTVMTIASFSARHGLPRVWSPARRGAA
jgi:uncharacterized membrane protein HdeD (DUF308 family)